MRPSLAVKYYMQKEIIDELFKYCRNREVIPKFIEGHFGKRPQTINFKQELVQLVKQGALSFHMSMERWNNPLRLDSNMKKSELDDLRTGWDLFLDIDSDSFKQATECAVLIKQALEFHEIRNYGIKFSGRSGWHFLIPFESFPDTVQGKKVKDLFPEAAQIIAGYLKEMIRPHLKEVLKKENPYETLDIDTVLISSRHLIRMPYSLNEKSGLASIPVDPDSIADFKLEYADPERIKAGKNIEFFKTPKKEEARQFFIQAFDYHAGIMKEEDKEVKRSERIFKPLKESINNNFFPPCIKKILSGLSDGRKRSLFILLNFLSKMGWNDEIINKAVKEWNQKNEEPLKEGYIQTQIAWFKKQKENFPPPNCDNNNYYKSIGVCSPDNLCRKIKNPVQYARRKANK